MLENGYVVSFIVNQSTANTAATLFWTGSLSKKLFLFSFPSTCKNAVLVNTRNDSLIWSMCYPVHCDEWYGAGVYTLPHLCATSIRCNFIQSIAKTCCKHIFNANQSNLCLQFRLHTHGLNEMIEENVGAIIEANGGLNLTTKYWNDLNKF